MKKKKTPLRLELKGTIEAKQAILKELHIPKLFSEKIKEELAPNFVKDENKIQ